MSYDYNNHYDNSGCLESVVSIILCVVILFTMMFGFNTCTASEWNDGKCPDCNVRYELRGVYKGTHYYACPDCGNEVERFGGR